MQVLSLYSTRVPFGVHVGSQLGKQWFAVGVVLGFVGFDNHIAA